MNEIKPSLLLLVLSVSSIIFQAIQFRPGSEVIKLFSCSTQLSMPVEHEILNVHKYKTIKKFGFFKAQISLEFSPLINVYEQEKVHAQLS